jgi:DNA integrity scanning protein DisA with diadenylate cyclase activity
VLALSRLSEKRHGVIIVMENEDSLDEILPGGVIIDAAVSAFANHQIPRPGVRQQRCQTFSRRRYYQEF